MLAFAGSEGLDPLPPFQKGLDLTVNLGKDSDRVLDPFVNWVLLPQQVSRFFLDALPFRDLIRLFFLYGKSIKKEKGSVKEKNRAEGRGKRGTPEKKENQWGQFFIIDKYIFTASVINKTMLTPDNLSILKN